MNTESMFNGMRRGKPDRWERVLERYHGDEDDWRAMLIPAERVLKLLRREHQAVVRMVTRFLNTELKGQSQDCPRCYLQACNDILDRLKARAR